MLSSLRTLAALGVFAILFTIRVQAAPAFDPTPYLRPQRLVNIGHRRINLYCSGHGSPTVVLGTDGDDATSAWRFVQPRVAHYTRVCSYDAPGFGFSDPASAGLDANLAVTDLHALLSRAGVNEPVVLVGYSLSGLYARLYADRYPRDVAGMVLVSPDIPDQDKLFARIAPSLGPMLQIDPVVQKCLASARKGEIRPGKPAYARCEYSPPDPTIPRTLLNQIHRQWEGAGLWSSFASEMGESRQSSAEVLREQRRYGAMPLIVLTTTKDIAALPIPPKQKASLTRAWVAWHQQIARLSSRGVDLVIRDSSQAVPIDRPGSVVSAIIDVIHQTRKTP